VKYLKIVQTIFSITVLLFVTFKNLGVDSIEALKYLFPNKTDEERAAMLSGYPFRMVQQTQQSLNQFIGLLGSLYQITPPSDPRNAIGV
jgi:hypothetical protein